MWVGWPCKIGLAKRNQFCTRPPFDFRTFASENSIIRNYWKVSIFIRFKKEKKIKQMKRYVCTAFYFHFRLLEIES